ncbi:MAG: ABC transporter permease [Candidatus Izemoplasmatales bacterium]
MFQVVSNPLLLPSPVEALKAFYHIFIQLTSLEMILYTFLRLFLAMALALIVGLLLGVIAGFNETFALFIRPIVTIFRTVPVISIVVILLIIFGFTLTPYLITFLMIFPLSYQAVYGGIKAIDKELIDVYLLEDNHFFRGMKYCYLPLIQGGIKTALLQSAGLGIKVLVMAEYLSQTKKSIGNAIYLAKANLQFDQVFAWTILLILLAIGIEILIEKYGIIKKKVEKTITNNSLKD